MQPLPVDVLQRREQQGKGKAKERRRRSGGAAEGGREVDTREHASHPASLAFAAEDCTYTAAPPSSQASPFQRSSPETSRGVGAFRPPLSSSPPPQIGVQTRKRPPLGPRTQTPSPWLPTAEEVPSQLIGGRVGPHASRLKLERNDPSESAFSGNFDYFDVPASPRSSGPRTFSPRTPRLERHLSTMPSVAEDELPSGVTEPQGSKDSPAASIESGSSKNSCASSFAYLLRNRRSDRRLLQERSMPRQHLQERPIARPQKSEATRSPSYYKPKIVEDTMTPLPPASPPIQSTSPFSSAPSATPASVASTESHLTAPSPDVASTPKRVKRHSNSPRNGESPARKARSQSPMTPSRSRDLDQPKRPRLQYSDSMLAQKTATRRALRIDLPSPNPGPHRMADKSGGGLGVFTMSAHRGSISESPAREAGPFTPLEIQTSSPQISHGNHYFRTFGEDTIYEKQNQAPVPHAQNVSAQRPEHEQRHQALETDSSNKTVLRRRRAKRDSLSFVSPKAPFTDSTVDIMKTYGGSPSTQSQEADSAYLANSRHGRTSNKSDNSISSYFLLGRRKQNASDEPVAAPSTMTKYWRAALTPTDHIRKESEPLSPTAVQHPKLRWALEVKDKHSHGKVGPAEQSTPVASMSPGPTGKGPSLLVATSTLEPTYRSSDGKEYKATSLTAVDAPNFLPSEMKRIDTPPLEEANTSRRRLRAFKSFFFDVTSLPSDDDNVSDPAWDTALPAKRHRPILPKSSLQSLIPKLSLPRLRHKPSQALDERRESDPLAVTDFHQTPYSQRYGDARRAKQTQMRAYVWDQTLREDDDSSAFGSVEHTFDLNIPEHLTNSPLCPLNEKHRSGGKAICPIHRRKRMTVNAYPARGRAGARREGSRGGRREPTIVFESGKRATGSVGNFASGDESRRTSGVT